MKQKLTVLMLSAAILCAVAVPAMAGAPTVQSEQSLPQSVLYYGQVREIGRDSQGEVVRLELDSESYGAYSMLISPETVWIDAGGRAASGSADLNEGEDVYLFHSPIAALSLPPQSTAFAVVRNIPQDMSCPHYHLVEEAAALEDGSVRITTDHGGLLISAGSDTGLSSYDGSSAPALSSLKPGMRIMAWYDVVLTSYPGQTYASHIMLLPQEAVSLEEGSPLELTLAGVDSQLTGRYENGVAMVPVAAAARELGLTASYTRGEDGPLVTVESEDFAVYLHIAQKRIYGSQKSESALSTSHFLDRDFGRDAYIQAPGTTWAPAELFTLLGKTVTLKGNHLTIG